MRRPSPNQVDHFPRVFIVDLCQKDGFLSAPARQVTTLTRTFALQVGHQPPPANSPGWQWLISFKHEILIVISTKKKIIDCQIVIFSAWVTWDHIWVYHLDDHLSLLQSLFLFCDLSGWSWQCKEGENLSCWRDNDPSRVTTTLPGWQRPRLRPRNGVGNWLGVPSTQNRQVDLPGDEFSYFSGRKVDFGGVK